METEAGHVCFESWRTTDLRHEMWDKPRDEEKRRSHQYPIHPMDLRGHRLDSRDAAKLGRSWRCVKGGISYEDFLYFDQVVSTPTVE